MKAAIANAHEIESGSPPTRVFWLQCHECDCRSGEFGSCWLSLVAAAANGFTVNGPDGQFAPKCPNGHDADYMYRDT